MGYCGNCGARNTDGSKFCTNCGAPMAAPSGQGNNGAFSGGTYGNGYGYDAQGQTRGVNPNEEVIYTDVTPRGIAMCIILSIVTFGIYGLYWIYKLNNEVNELAGDRNATGGGLVLLFFFITLGIYGLYWYYKMGQKCDYIRQSNSYSSIVFLILAIFGLSIVSNALIQDTINRVLE